MAFLRSVFGRTEKKKRDFPNIKLDQDPEQFWETVGELGDGAFGKVYKAKHRVTGKIAAAKIVDLSSDEDLDDFAVEIDILVECVESEYVIELHEAYVFNKKLWMLIEFCAGGAMDDVLQELNHGLNETQMKVVTKHMFEALADMHDRYIFHRDLKAGNLLLCPDGKVKLADFGVSAFNKNSRQRRDSFIGTPFWMAPEVIQCETNKDCPYDNRADIWSAGITMIELADVNPPNHEMHPMRVLFKIPKADPPTVIAPSKWSREFNDFVAKCLVKEPEGRPSARQMLQHPFLQGVSDTLPMKVLFAEIRADVHETLQELGEESNDSGGDSFSAASDNISQMSCFSHQDSLGDSIKPQGSIREGSENQADKSTEEGERLSKFKSLKRVRTYRVEGKEYTSTTEVVVDVTKGKAMEQQGQRLMRNQRKLEIRDRKVLQREEVKETQQLFNAIQRDKEEQEKRFDFQRADLEKRYDSLLEALAKSQKRDIEKFEKKQRDDYFNQAKHVKNVQLDAVKRYKKEIKNQEKVEEKMAISAMAGKSKSDKKQATKQWKAEYAERAAKEESEYERKKQAEFDAQCQEFKRRAREACRDLEEDFLSKRHDLIQRREVEYWETEQFHFQEHYKLSKAQLLEAFRLQYHQMTERHKKQVEQHNRRCTIQTDIITRRHAVENKIFPQNLKKQKLQALAVIRKQLRIKKVSRQEEKETLKKCEVDILKKQKEEVDKLAERQKDELDQLQLDGDAAMKEIIVLQETKVKGVKEREEMKLDEHNQNFQAQIMEYNTRLEHRKEELIAEFTMQRDQLASFYNSASAASNPDEDTNESSHRES